MDENTQILDVTYGNFTCRLEGFEDSVETMKTVVSFFHELAGHDRFMDVEPQAPNMEALALLTEEQTGVPVDAEGEGNHVSLRVRKEDEQIAPEVQSFEEDADQDPFVAEEPEETTAEVQANVADKLQRLRDVTMRAAPVIADDFSEDLGDAAEAVPAANPLTQRLAELAKRNAEAVEDVVEETEEAIAGDDTAEEVEDDVAEDNPADADTLNVFSNMADEDDEAAVDALEEKIEEPAVHEPDDVEVAADNAFETEEMGAEDEVDDAFSDDSLATNHVEPAAAEDHDTNAQDGHETDSGDNHEVIAEDDALRPDLDEEGEEQLLNHEEEPVMEEEPASGGVSEDQVEIAEMLARDAPLVLTADDQPVAEADEEIETDDYNDDDEFDLEAEVAKVEAELAAREGNEFARHGLPRHVEDAMSRIMSQTDQHLNQPENRRHRDAFAQLKAAVAATEAARQLGDKGGDKRDPDEIYKDDLGAHEEAKEEPKVTPPEPTAVTPQAPQKSPPLQLVKSQEVAPAPAHLDPAAASKTTDGATERLRQIATKKETDASEDTGGFAAFVDAHGVTDLVDRMEAAGAYICFVEGEADFSRPQVMKVVQSASSTEISREDGLRSFGRLLRQARLVKQANGRFQVAEDTQYRPDGSKVARG